MQKSDEVESNVEEKVSLYKLLKRYPITFGENFSKHMWNKEGISKYPPLHNIVANLSWIEIKNYGERNKDQMSKIKQP